MPHLPVWGDKLKLPALQADFVNSFCTRLNISATDYYQKCRKICNTHSLVLKQTADKCKINHHAAYLQLTCLYIPLALWVAKQSAKSTHTPYIIGINGAQGSGKTTLCEFVKTILTQILDKTSVCFSMDDILLSFNERKKLATRIHPLLKTRGPGTHDITLGLNTLEQLQNCTPTTPAFIPFFDKSLQHAQGDITPKSNWHKITTPPDIILLEGWNTGQRPKQPPFSNTCTNNLEKTLDPDCKWKQYVDKQLEHEYSRLWQKLNSLIMLKVQNMECVFKNRQLQEKKLRQSLDSEKTSGTKHAMTVEQVNQFVNQYESDTRDMLKNLPQFCDIVIDINKNHAPEVHKNKI